MRLLPPALLAIFVCFATTPVFAQTNLKASWGFEENAGTGVADSSGNANTGVLTNGPSWIAGPIGHGLSFDGADDRVVVAANATLDLSTSFTLSAWIKLEAPVTRDMFIVVRPNSGPTGTSYALALNSLGWTQLLIGTPGGLGAVQSVSQLPLHQWVHIAGTFEGTTGRLYINGELRASSEYITGPIVATTSDLRLGGGSAYGFQGSLDEVRIYDRVLTLTEIMDDRTRPVDTAIRFR